MKVSYFTLLFFNSNQLKLCKVCLIMMHSLQLKQIPHKNCRATLQLLQIYTSKHWKTFAVYNVYIEMFLIYISQKIQIKMSWGMQSWHQIKIHLRSRPTPSLQYQLYMMRPRRKFPAILRKKNGWIHVTLSRLNLGLFIRI